MVRDEANIYPRVDDRSLWPADRLVRAVPVTVRACWRERRGPGGGGRVPGPLRGLTALDRGQAAELVGWKFQSLPHRKALTMRGISPERWDGRDGAPGLIRTALATGDDYQALATMASGAGGIYRFGPAMSSAVLAACRPGRFTIADSRALATLRGLGRMPPGPPGFRLGDWLPYLRACRILAGQCGLSLRQLDRALWIGASSPQSPG
jgi:hypothetical protein